MAQSYKKGRSSTNHATCHRIYNIPVVAMPVKSLIAYNNYKCMVYDKKTKKNTQNNRDVTSYERKIMDAALCNEYASFIFIFSGQDEHSCKKMMPDKIILIVSSKHVSSRYIDRFICANTMPNDCACIRNTITINTSITAEIDISNLPQQSVDTMSNTMQTLFEELKQQLLKVKINGAKKSKYSLETHSMPIDLENNTRITSLGCEENGIIKTSRKNTHRGNTARAIKNRLFVAYSSPYMCIFFKMYLVEGRHMSINILSTCKTSSVSIVSFMKLTVLYNYGRLTFNENKPKNALSVYGQNWHVIDVCHGYLLTSLLKRYNIASLFIIKKPYFIITTTKTRNISVEFNFKLSNAIAYSIEAFEICTLDFTEWNEEHNHILDASSIEFCVYKVSDKMETRSIVTDIQTLECEINPSYYGSTSTLKYSHTDEKNHSDDVSKTNFNSVSEDFGITSKPSSEISLNCIRSSAITLTLSIDGMLSEARLCLRKCKGFTNLPKANNAPNAPSILHQRMVNLAKDFFTKLFDKSIALKTFFGIPHINYDRTINECIFDSIVCEFTNTISHIWLKITPQICRSVVYKCLGLNYFCNPV